jgi:DNA-binding transcriptional MerR regulator
MSEKGNQEGGELLTLTEVSNRTNISMPTLQRYKKEYQDRIPSVGRGRKQRYPVAALDVFEQLKSENIKRRGRPRGSGGGGGGRRAGRPAAAPRAKSTAAPSAASGGGDLLTLTEVGERTGISYPTLVRYVKLHGDEIPSEGEGRRRRYHPQAVGVFQRLRSESSRGRKPKGGRPAAPSAAPARVPGGASSAGAAGDGKLAQRVASLERTQERLERQIQDMIQLVRKPITVTVQRAK